MKPLTKLKNLIAGLPDIFRSCMGKDIPEAGVKVGSDSLLGQAFAEGYREDLIKCEKKLGAAAAALRKLKCLTFENKYVYVNEVWESMHKIAQDAWRETQK